MAAVYQSVTNHQSSSSVISSFQFQSVSALLQPCRSILELLSLLLKLLGLVTFLSLYPFAF